MSTHPSAQSAGGNGKQLSDSRRLRSGFTNIESVFPGKLPTAKAAGERRAEWAIIVNHGMGQQVHFETLEQVVVALRDAEYRARRSVADVNTRVVKLPGANGKEFDVLRAEMDVTDSRGNVHPVDLYESYWAPLTEGKVTLWDCTKFLLEGGGRGFWFLYRYGGRFDRWLFGGMKKFPIGTVLTAVRLVIAMLLVFAPILLATVVTVGQMGGALLALLGTDAAAIARAGKTALALRAFTPDVECFEVCLLSYALSAGLLPKVYRLRFFAGRNLFLRAIRIFVQSLAVVGALASLAALFYVEGRFVPHFVRFWAGDHSAPPVSRWITGLVWFGALASAGVARWFLIEYMGDVAAYLSAHKLSKFDELRENIQKAVFNAISGVYRKRAEGKDGLLYRNVMVVGHSLGSVISYDVLNRLLLEDEIAATAAAPAGRVDNGLRVQERTKLLLTFGSPLDKAAFIFRTKGGTDELREAAAAAWQPLIRKYQFRPDTWINIYSWFDIISGALHFYDDPKNTANGGDKRVRNTVDFEALLPLAAHTQYWTNRKFGDTIYQTIR
jgi:hypothetical protein